jgi:hypothetical protein
MIKATNYLLIKIDVFINGTKLFAGTMAFNKNIYTR